MPKAYTVMFENILKPYSAILFLNHKIAGLIVLAITFLNPSVALSGLVAVISTLLFAKFIEIKDQFLAHGFYIYNSLLVGMGIGYIFELSLKSMALIAISAIFTFVFSFMINRLFSNYKIPILSLPFSIVTMFIYLASLKYSTLYSTLVNHANMFDISLPLVLSAYLKSMGTIFFLPNNVAGLLLLGVIFYFSRIVFIMATIGFYFGIFSHSMLLGSFTQALYDPYAFNYILVSIALCGIFLLPTVKNFFIALLAIVISVVLTDAIGVLFQYYAIPVFTLPFNLTVITFIFILSMSYYKEFNYTIKNTPEASLSYYLSTIFRFGEVQAKIALPFSGEWDVYQAFSGEWTHKGNYQYAYDFVKKKEGKTYKGEGLHLDEYYAYGESILSPVEGYVVDARHDLPDNYIGTVDKVNNWGNYIIIRTNIGFFVEISHLMQHSLTVHIGAYVNVNEVLGKCGNSGYSPEPHIHVQVQSLGTIGAFTQKFCFTEYYEKNTLIFNSLPQLGSTVSSVITDKSIQSKLLFILDEVFSYDVFENKHYKETISFTVKMNPLGEFYFEDAAANKLYFHTTSTQFYFYHYEGKTSYLQWFFILAPRYPFVNKEKISFTDYLPVNLIKNRYQVLQIELLSTVNKSYAKEARIYEHNAHQIHSKGGSIALDSTQKGFGTLTFNAITLERK